MINIKHILDTEYPESWEEELRKHPGGQVLLSFLKNSCVCGSAGCAQEAFKQTFVSLERGTLEAHLDLLLAELTNHKDSTFACIQQVVSYWNGWLYSKTQLDNLRPEITNTTVN